MGVPPKPADRRQRRNTPALGLAETPSRLATPDPPAGLSDETLATWESYWSSPVAGAVVESDLPALHRLFGYRDAWTRTAQDLADLEATDGIIVIGSTGQPVLHPLTKLLGSIEANMRPLEDRFGLTPLARLRLGITVAEAESSLAAHNARITADARPPGSAVDGGQPRPRGR